MQETVTPPKLTLPSRRDPEKEAAVLRGRANSLFDTFRKELDDVKDEINRTNQLGLQGMLSGLPGFNQDTAATGFTLGNANGYMPFTLQRIELSYSYQSQGLVRTVINQPIEDAFRGGVKFKSSELDEKDLKELNKAFARKNEGRFGTKTALGRVSARSGYNQTKSDQDAVKETLTWCRLFGGAGLMVNTDQKYDKELRVDAIGEDSPLEFIACDRWELILQQINIDDDLTPTPFNYYGLPIHRSRVQTINGAEAPSYIRMRLQGWGMSILEDSLRAINIYLKFEKLLFELLDEAKIDVYKITGFNASLATAAGTAAIQRRVGLSNQLKNFQSALTMDMLDDYQQKTLTFSGIPEIYEQVRINLCAYLRIPYDKVFGQSAGGFGSGKDSLDNYNSTVEMIRETANPLVETAGGMRCQQLFGFIPDDLEIEWSPLDVLDGVEQEAVKTSKQARILGQFQVGLLSGQEACEALQKEGLLLVECEVLLGLREPEPPMTENPDEAQAGRDHEKDMVKASAAAKPKGPKK